MSIIAKVAAIVKATQSGRKVQLPDDIRELSKFIPRPLQQQMRERMKRFNSWVVHRRFGKSVLAVNTLGEKAIECPFPNGRYAYLAPTYDMARNIAWTYLKDFADTIPTAEKMESKLTIELPTRVGGRAQISLYGTDTPKQRLRGMYLDGVVFDEWAQIPPHVWTQQVRPMLSDVNRSGYDELMEENQWAIFMTTPFGRNHAYHMHTRAEKWAAGLGAKMGGDNIEIDGGEDIIFRSDWAAELWPASKTGVLNPRELALAKQDMNDDDAYDQEYECSWDAAVKGAIFAKQLVELKDRGRIHTAPYNPLLPVHTGWDLGFDDCTAIWFVQCVANEVRVIDYYEAAGAALDHYADVLEKKGYRYGRHYWPHDIEQHELGTGKSRASVLRAFGVRGVTVPRSNVEDGIAAVRLLLPRCIFDATACEAGLNRLALYHREYDERQMVFRQKPKHDWTSHSADALRTLAVGLKKFTPEGEMDYSQQRTAEL
jgi:phage terminase large subunit